MIIYGHPNGEHVMEIILILLNVVDPFAIDLDADGDVFPPVIDHDDDDIIPIVQVDHLDDDLGIREDSDIAILEIAPPEITVIDITSSDPSTPETLSHLHSPNTILPAPTDVLPTNIDSIPSDAITFDHISGSRPSKYSLGDTAYLTDHPTSHPFVGPPHYSIRDTSQSVEHLPFHPSVGPSYTTSTPISDLYRSPYAAGPSLVSHTNTSCSTIRYHPFFPTTHGWRFISSPTPHALCCYLPFTILFRRTYSATTTTDISTTTVPICTLTVTIS
ncbi:hypothetical protein Hanom_Chr00s027778g01767401 [Helianthus anomalus]